MSATFSPYLKMQNDELDLDELMKTLTDNFNILADEVQLLSDRKTILEHKLRFAHEQYQYLADKYAPSDPEISNTLAKLQLPPELKVHSPERATFVPLPPRKPSGSKQQTAEAIRDGRRASKRLPSLRGWRNASESGDRSTSGMSNSIIRTSQLGTAATTALEQDFTVPGKRSQLLCPFAEMTSRPKTTGVSYPQPTSDPISGPDSERRMSGADPKPTSHHSAADPICAALYSEVISSPPPSVTGSAAKCPIRYLDQHSPEEVARYFEIHKHEIPRSHEICVKRYQRNEEDIRKLDAKYGSLVSMISGLGQKHQPMLQVKEDEGFDREEKRSNERVENWAKAVNVDGVGDGEAVAPLLVDDEDREGRFDRQMKEVRVGESPSRPWGISVPYVDHPDEGAVKQDLPRSAAGLAKAAAKSPTPKTSGKCPFPHNKIPKVDGNAELLDKPLEMGHATAVPKAVAEKPPQTEERWRERLPAAPTYIHHPDLSKGTGPVPQMVFTGPVFIGYPIEQAMALMQNWQTDGNA